MAMRPLSSSRYEADIKVVRVVVVIVQKLLLLLLPGDSAAVGGIRGVHGLATSVAIFALATKPFTRSVGPKSTKKLASSQPMKDNKYCSTIKRQKKDDQDRSGSMPKILQ